MITDEALDNFLLMSAHTWPSVEALRPEYARWRRWLESEGFDEVPPLRTQDPKGADAINHLCLLAKQASKNRDDPAGEHHLRNLTRVRPWKS